MQTRVMVHIIGHCCYQKHVLEVSITDSKV